MELAEALADVAVDVAADVAGRTEPPVELTGGTELEVRVEIQQFKELEVFDSLRLSVVLLIAICY